jgi:hypothetical protein
MTMIDLHSEATRSPNIPYHEFLLRYKVSGSTVYGFVEGIDDPSFYRGLIEQHLPPNWSLQLIKAGNKTKTLELFSLVDWNRFPAERICFFVDRDLSDFLNCTQQEAKNIYITDGYSIENELHSYATFRRTLEEVLGLPAATPSDEEAIERYYCACTSTFEDGMAAIMAQIIVWRRAAAVANLNKIDLNELFEFSSKSMRLRPHCATPIARSQLAASQVGLPASTQDDLEHVITEFAEANRRRKLIRGKYVVWLLVNCLNSVHASAMEVCKELDKPPKARVALGEKNAVVIIGPRVRCPLSLKTFVARTFLRFIESQSRTQESHQSGMPSAENGFLQYGEKGRGSGTGKEN